MLTGQPPFQGKSITQVIYRVMHESRAAAAAGTRRCRRVTTTVRAGARQGPRAALRERLRVRRRARPARARVRARARFGDRGRAGPREPSRGDVVADEVATLPPAAPSSRSAPRLGSATVLRRARSRARCVAAVTIDRVRLGGPAPRPGAAPYGGAPPSPPSSPRQPASRPLRCHPGERARSPGAAHRHASRAPDAARRDTGAAPAARLPCRRPRASSWR